MDVILLLQQSSCLVLIELSKFNSGIPHIDNLDLRFSGRISPMMTLLLSKSSI